MRVLMLLAAIVLATTFVAHGVLGPPNTFWTVDNGAKAIVCEHLARGRADLSYPGESLDPERRSFPMPAGGAEPYVWMAGERILSQYASPFPWALRPFFRVLGFIGYGVLPALGAGLTALAAGLLARRLSPGRVSLAAAAIVVFASPLLFYGAVLWEHTSTMATFGLALVAITAERPRPFLAGLGLAATAFLREECVLLGVATCVAAWPLLGRRGFVRLGLGFGLGPLALAGFYRATTGSWLGPHVAANSPAPFANIPAAVEGLLLSPGFSGVPPWLLPAVVVLAALPAVRRRVPDLAANLVALLAAAISLLAWLRFPGTEDSALALRHSNSALVFLPWLLVLLRPVPASSPHELPRFLGRTAILFTALFVILVPARSITGVHPGPRMLLPLLPALAALVAVRAANAGRGGRLVLLATCACGALWGARSLDLLHAKRELSGRILSAIAQDPRNVVVTDQFWLPTELGALWFDKRFFLLTDSRTLSRLAERARDQGERELLVVSAPGQGTGLPTASIRSARFPAFSVDLSRLPVGTEPPPP
ncbi:MAG: hypothetical protein R3B81_07845 [bacterium]